MTPMQFGPQSFEADAAADVLQLPLSRAALGVGLRESSGPDDGRRNVRGEAVPDHRTDGSPATAMIAWSGTLGRSSQARKAGQAADAASRPAFTGQIGPG